MHKFRIVIEGTTPFSINPELKPGDALHAGNPREISPNYVGTLLAARLNNGNSTVESAVVEYYDDDSLECSDDVLNKVRLGAE